MSEEFDIVVAGGGIAGLTAGLAAARAGHKTLVLTGDLLGGNLLSIEKIEGHPDYADGIAGFDLLPTLQADGAEAGAEFAATELQKLAGEGGSWKLTTSEGEVEAKAIILATGAGPRGLGIPGEEEFKGRGVSHCASCDAPLLRDKVVAVIGGGDSALQESLTLAEAASKVIILQKGDRLTAQQTYIDRVTQNPKIEVRPNATVEAIVGDQAVTGVKLAGGETISCDGVFVYVGLQPNTAYLDGKLALDSDGKIPTDSEMATSLPGLFAAGLVRVGSPGRAAISAEEATAAAAAADRYLKG
jgi:thioredoxin reductase (NADPH)